MNKSFDPRAIDLAAITDLFNRFMVVIFLPRTLPAGHSQVTGVKWIALTAVLAVVVFQKINAKRGQGFVILPSLMGLCLIVEVIPDHVLALDFRNTSLIGPYPFLYYVSLLGMIGYSFLAENKYGFITLVTYFLSQSAALYSSTKAGHG